MYRIPRYRISLVREPGVPAEVKRVSNSRDACTALRPLFEGADREQMVVAALDAKHQIIGVNTIAIGSVTASLVHPREVFKPAILLNAVGLILAHNHPSDSPEPSHEDRQLTKRLVGGGELLGIGVLDHIILSSNSYYSFSDHGALTAS